MPPQSPTAVASRPGFSNEITAALLKEKVILPCVNEALNRRVREGSVSFATTFSKPGLTPLGPLAFVPSYFKKICSTEEVSKN